MTITVMAFALLFKDMGSGHALIQREGLDEKSVSSVFIFSLLLGLFVSISIFCLSAVVAQFFGDPRLEGMLQVLALAFPILSMGVVPQALLERSNKFKQLAAIETLSIIAALGVAIAYAKNGGGAYALLANFLVMSVMQVVGCFVAAAWVPRFIFCADRFRQIAEYGIHLFGFTLVNFFARNADSILIGKFLGASALGFYSLAYKVMLFPLQNISASFNRAMFPALSHAGSVDKAEKIYSGIVERVSLLSFPLMLGVLAARADFVDVIFGDKWAAVEEIIFWLAPVGMLQSITTTTGLLFTATGNTKNFFYWGVFSSTVQVGAIYIGLKGGVTWVAICYGVANFLLAYPMFYFATRCIGSSPRIILRALEKPLIIACFVWGGVFLCQQISALNDASSFLRLLICLAAGGVIYMTGIRYFYGGVSWIVRGD